MSAGESRLWSLREMAPDEVDRICELDVSETGDVVYKWVDGEVVAEDKSWSRTADHGGEWPALAEWTRARLLEGGVAFGAFDADRLVGFIAVKHRLVDDMALLAALWVSREYRRQGVATTLTQRAIEAARSSGATAIYVSAAPTASAQGFYRSVGFRPTRMVHMEMFVREPEDIHMIMRLPPV